MSEVELVDHAAILLREAREQRARADRLEKSIAEVRAERDEEKKNALAAEAALAVVIESRDLVRAELAAEKERRERADTALAQALIDWADDRAKVTADRNRLLAIERAARLLVAALPACDLCPRPATRAFRRGSGRWCDVHDDGWGPAPEYPRAAPLRALVALMETS